MIRERVKLPPMLAQFFLQLIRKHGRGMALLVNPVRHYLPAARGVPDTAEEMADQQACIPATILPAKPSQHCAPRYR